MDKNKIFSELEDIHCKYKRLQSLIGIMQMFVAEVGTFAGAPADSLANALYEVELELEKKNERVKSAIQQKGGEA